VALLLLLLLLFVGVWSKVFVNGFQDLLENNLLPGASNLDSKMFYLKMKINFYRYLAEVADARVVRNETTNGLLLCFDEEPQGGGGGSPRRPLLSSHVEMVRKYKADVEAAEGMIGRLNVELSERRREYAKYRAVANSLIRQLREEAEILKEELRRERVGNARRRQESLSPSCMSRITRWFRRFRNQSSASRLKMLLSIFRYIIILSSLSCMVWIWVGK